MNVSENQLKVSLYMLTQLNHLCWSLFFSVLKAVNSTLYFSVLLYCTHWILSTWCKNMHLTTHLFHIFIFLFFAISFCCCLLVQCCDCSFVVVNSNFLHGHLLLLLCSRVTSFFCLCSHFFFFYLRWMSRKRPNQPSLSLSFSLTVFESGLSCFLTLSSSRSMASTWSPALMRKWWVRNASHFLLYKRKPHQAASSSLSSSVCHARLPHSRLHTFLPGIPLIYAVHLRNSCSLYSPPAPQST